MASHPSRRLRALILVPIAAASLVAGCGSSSTKAPPTIDPARPSVAAATVPAAGTVVPAPAGEALAFDPVSRRIAVIGPDAVVLYSVDGGVREAARVPLTGPAHAVVPDGDGGFLIAAKGGVLRIARDGDRADVAAKIDGDVLSVAPYHGDRTAYALAGTADGRVLVLTATDGVRTITGLVEASEILVGSGEAGGGRVAVVDRRQAMLQLVDVGAGKLTDAVRVGRGVTNATIDRYGRIIAIDTGKDQVIGYTIDPFMERFLAPAPGAPWAVEYDDTARLAWITATATNQVVGYALGSGAPVEKQRHPTVRQPNSVAVDPKTGEVFVLSAAGDGLQVLPTR